MGNVWDIMPPRPKLSPKPSKKSRKKTSGISVIFVLFLIVVSFYVIYSINSQASPAIANVENSQISEKNKKDLFIKLINGTGQSDQTPNLKKTLEDQGFQLTKIEDALNLYDASIVYYQKDYKNDALEIAGLFLKYNMKVQQFTKDSSYDLIVVIGPN